ncbi:unnamed protein product [Adineta ricciae]|uniref:Uncharacterized protein n=1 Tax=Adineta ricciae TaxID=249248 RepID=A0A815IWD0_ADIRI|nr:unnamed protein product [Adineta ricciae]CAF1371328.1 unnamed protein product [Adineta ricciae]
MTGRHRQSWYQLYLLSCTRELIDGTDQLLDFIYNYVEIPIQSVCSYCINFSLVSSNRPLWFHCLSNSTQILAQSYVITFVLYFLGFVLANIYAFAIQKHYFLDPILSIDRQCLNIQFVHVNNDKPIFTDTPLKENFLRENLIIGQESPRNSVNDHEQLHALFDSLQDSFFVICQRSLYLYARFQSYSPLLHSAHSSYRFSLSKYASSFAIDQPPFIDLCVHATNHSHLEQIQSRLRSRATKSYSSVNIFLFDFNYTQVSITLYELNKNSTHLERVSIHTGWLRDLYSQFDSFKYNYALSTVLFDGLSLGQSFVDYFRYSRIPVPADPLLALTEMVQESVLTLPLCAFS